MVVKKMEDNNQQNNHGEGEQLSYIKSAVFLFLLFVFGFLLWLPYRGGDAIQTATESTNTSVEVAAFTNPFDTVLLEAQAAHVWDVNKGETLYALNAESQLPLASLTKLMTAYAASEVLLPSSTVVVELDSLQEEGDDGLFSSESWKLKDLLDFTLLVSSNDGANVLASAAGSKLIGGGTQSDVEEAFLKKMNKIASDIKLTQTYFVNETGLDPTTETSGSYGSARDVNRLLEHILQANPSLLSATVYNTLSFNSQSGFSHTASNTNDMVGDIPGLIASKTGFTDLAGGNLAIAFDAGLNRPIIITVLGSSVDGRFSDVRKLIAATLDYLKTNKI